MPGDVLTALAQFAGQTVAAAAITDVWESVRDRFARLLGRHDARRTETAEGWLAQTREQLAAAGPEELERAWHAASERWTGRVLRADWDAAMPSTRPSPAAARARAISAITRVLPDPAGAHRTADRTVPARPPGQARGRAPSRPGPTTGQAAPPPVSLAWM